MRPLENLKIEKARLRSDDLVQPPHHRRTYCEQCDFKYIMCLYVYRTLGIRSQLSVFFTLLCCTLVLG